MAGQDHILQRLNSAISKAEIVSMAREVDASGASAIAELIPYLYPRNTTALRISWLLENVVIPNSQWHAVFQDQLVEALIKSGNPVIRRNIAKTIASMVISSEHFDALYDFSLSRISDSAEAVAVKVHCISIAFQIVKHFPDLATELKAVLEDECSKNSVAFAANARKIMKKLKKPEP